MLTVLSIETWAVVLTAVTVVVLTIAIRLLWRRRKGLEDL